MSKGIIDPWRIVEPVKPKRDSDSDDETDVDLRAQKSFKLEGKRASILFQGIDSSSYAFEYLAKILQAIPNLPSYFSLAKKPNQTPTCVLGKTIYCYGIDPENALLRLCKFLLKPELKSHLDKYKITPLIR